MGFKDWLSNNSDTFLMVTGIIGSGLAAILFAKAGAKTAREIDIQRESMIDEREKDIPAKEKAKIFAKNFWAPCALLTISDCAIVGSGHIKDKKLAATTLAGNLTAQAFSDYRNEVKKSLGDAQDRKIRDNVAQESVTKDYDNNDGQMPTPINAPQVGDVLCKDSITHRYFWSTPEKIRRAENLAVSRMADEFTISLNEWYDILAIEGVNAGVGDILEWTCDDHFSLYLTTTMTPDERPCIYVEYNPFPHERKRYMGDY